MSLHLGLNDNGLPTISWNGHLLVTGIQVEILPSDAPSRAERAMTALPWEPPEESDTGRAHRTLRQALSVSGASVGEALLTVEEEIVRCTITFTRGISLPPTKDSFEASSVGFPRFGFAQKTRFLLTTFGLGDSGDGGFGGYWPEARVGCGIHELPAQSFAPLVLFDDQGAIAVAPSSQLLTSSLLADATGVRRVLHGSIDGLPAGASVETIFAGGRSASEALRTLGDSLLTQGGKQRPDPHEHILTSQVGWWNAYGGHFTEPIHPLDAKALTQTLESLGAQGVAPAYVGIDLWYPYEQIGQALRFSPDPAKYPDGLAAIAQRFEIPTVLHLSALAAANEYGIEGSDSGVYREIAEELDRQEAIVAWHDWLRTQQHLTPTLRSNPEAADRWFSGIATGLDHRDLEVLLCMQTMGMVLASTREKNILGARSAIDYLFAQETALDTLAAIGHEGFRNEATTLGAMRRQNLLLGSVLYAFGLLPFHDLFLTRSDPKLGGSSPRAEAVLRAVSCGPVGLGDGPGNTDAALVRSLISSEGRLLQPDHPPLPDEETLGQPVEVYRTEHRAGELHWEYVLAINTTDSPQRFRILQPAGTRIWNGLTQCAAPRMDGALPPGELAYFVLIPEVDGIAPLGLWTKLVPSPSRVVIDAQAGAPLRLDLSAPQETLAFLSESTLAFTDQQSRPLNATREGSLWLVQMNGGVTGVRALRR